MDVFTNTQETVSVHTRKHPENEDGEEEIEIITVVKTKWFCFHF